MISENPAIKLEDGTKVCRHTVEVLCPNCSRDVDEAELAAQKCNDCGFDLRYTTPLEKDTNPNPINVTNTIIFCLIENATKESSSFL